MKVKPKRIRFERWIRDGYGDVEITTAKQLYAKRDLVADLDGKYSYSLVDLWITLEIEKIGGSGHFTQLECRLKLPASQLEFTRQFGITISEPQKETEILLPFNNSLGLGKTGTKNDELIVDIRDNSEIVLSQSIPVIFDAMVTTH